jgi:hypothetical protein
MSEEQRVKLHHILKQVKEAQAEVWEAFETTIMSDAKSSVYGLRLSVEEDRSLDSGIKARLIPHFEQAWSNIVGLDSTYHRAQRSHASLGAAEACIREELRKIEKK